MLKTKQVSEIMNMPVYTDSGDYFGEVEESLITSNKIYGWKVRSTKRSYLGRMMNNKIFCMKKKFNPLQRLDINLSNLILTSCDFMTNIPEL